MGLEASYQFAVEQLRTLREEGQQLSPEAIEQLRTMPYAAYLQTAHWRAVRSEVLMRAGRRCAQCRRRRATCVHHVLSADMNGYEHRGVEMDVPGSVVALCSECHEHAHRRHARLIWRDWAVEAIRERRELAAAMRLKGGAECQALLNAVAEAKGLREIATGDDGPVHAALDAVNVRCRAGAPLVRPTSYWRAVYKAKLVSEQARQLGATQPRVGPSSA